MKRYILIFIIIFLIVGVFTVINYNNNKPEKSGFVSNGIFYPVDLFFEDLQLKTTFRWENKINTLSNGLEERLLELVFLLQQNDVEQKDINATVEEVDNHLNDIYMVLESNSIDDPDQIKEIVLSLDKTFYNFDDRVDDIESNLIIKIESSLEKVNEEDISNTEPFDLLREKVTKVLLANNTVSSVSDLFRENNFNITNLLSDSERSSFMGQLRNKEFENLREETSVFNINLPSGFFMTIGPSDEVETISFFRDLIIEKKENKFAKYKAHVSIAEAQLYGDIEDKDISTDQWNVYQRFLSEAEAEFNAGNYKKAQNLAEKAKKHIITVLEADI